jgi:hypothetical protein
MQSSRKMFAALTTFAALAVPLAAHAQAPEAASSSSTAAACPPGNLLAGKRPYAWSDIRGRIELTTDGVVSPEGAIWDAPLAVVLETGASTLSWDLGAPTTVNAAWVQADANDYYTLWGSMDGRVWKDLGRIDTADGVHGLRGRKVGLGGAVVRYVRFGEGQGDNYYSLSEMQLFCQVPDTFPPPVRVQEAPRAIAAKGPFWDNDTSARWELILALLGLGLLHWGYVARRRGRLVKLTPEAQQGGGETAKAGKPADQKAPSLICPVCHNTFALDTEHVEGQTCAICVRRPDLHRKLRDGLLAVLGVLAALTYINFGSFHFGNFIHDWEWTHYYVGSKYFHELSYDRLYECMSVADIEDGLKRRVELRKITNLRTNHLEPTDEIVKHPESCKQHFSAERWESFKHDVRFFRNRQGAKRWDDLQTDHGYNGTPVWNIAGSVLANLAPASTTQLNTLAMLDPAYLVATLLVIWWAFGWRVLSVALIAFATNFPSRFYWTGGSYLRWDWLFYMIAGIACLKKDKPMLAGAALAYATLLRIFPGFVFVGPLAGLGYHVWKHRRLEARYTRFFIGAALACALLVPVSMVVSGGLPAYQQFVKNTAKHKETPLTNYMGLRTVIAWRPSEVGRLMKNDKLTDPWSTWKQARLDGYKHALPLYLALALAFLALIAVAARHVEPWAAAAIGVTFIPIGVELTCYYYAFILGVGLLYAKREEAGRLLLALTALTQFFAWAPLRGMATWIDEQYTLMSAFTVALFGAIVWLFREPAPVESDAAAVVGPAREATIEPSAALVSAAGGASKKKKRR